VERRIFNEGKSYIFLYQKSCQLLSSLIKSQILILANNNSNTNNDNKGFSVEKYVNSLVQIFEIVYIACDTMISPSPLYISGCTSVLLLQVCIHIHIHTHTYNIHIY
jgi:hypothetical protein